MADIKVILQEPYLSKCCAIVGEEHLCGAPKDGSLMLYGLDYGGYDATNRVTFERQKNRKMFITFTNLTNDEVAKFDKLADMPDDVPF